MVCAIFSLLLIPWRSIDCLECVASIVAGEFCGHDKPCGLAHGEQKQRPKS